MGGRNGGLFSKQPEFSGMDARDQPKTRIGMKSGKNDRSIFPVGRWGRAGGGRVERGGGISAGAGRGGGGDHWGRDKGRSLGGESARQCGDQLKNQTHQQQRTYEIREYWKGHLAFARPDARRKEG